MSQPTIHTVLTDIAYKFTRADLYFGHGTETSEDEALYLVLSVCQLPFDSGSQVYEQVVEDDKLVRIQQLATQRIQMRKPMAYLLKEAWFAGVPFYVDERVLIPRSPIAELLHKHFIPWLASGKVNRVLDLCTGSGCIGISTALLMPQVSVVASDISLDALAVSQINVERYELQDRVQLVASDVFSHIEGKFDVIVSNPPYVDVADILSMPLEYTHEPVDVALASGNDGLDCTRKILSQAADYLCDGGVLIVEVGNSQEALVNAYPDLPFIWLEFECGGDGVFLLRREDLV